MSRKSSNTALNRGQDWIVDAGGIQILIEKIGRFVKITSWTGFRCSAMSWKTWRIIHRMSRDTDS